MEQVYKELEQRHDEALSRGFHVMDNKINSFKKVVAIALALITLGCAFGIYSVHNLSTTTTGQFCKLNQERYTDQVKQYTATIKYLYSPQSKAQSLQDLNKIVRQQLPKTVHDLAQARKTQPPVCRSAGYQYPNVPTTVQILHKG